MMTVPLLRSQRVRRGRLPSGDRSLGAPYSEVIRASSRSHIPAVATKKTLTPMRPRVFRSKSYEIASAFSPRTERSSGTFLYGEMLSSGLILTLAPRLEGWSPQRSARKPRTSFGGSARAVVAARRAQAVSAIRVVVIVVSRGNHLRRRERGLTRRPPRSGSNPSNLLAPGSVVPARPFRRASPPVRGDPRRAQYVARRWRAGSGERGRESHGTNDGLVAGPPAALGASRRGPRGLLGLR